MRINHNSLAYTANNNLTGANSKLAAAVERLSSGYKLNSSKDDTAGMAISHKMQAQIRGLSRATQNADDGVSLIQTAEGTLGELQSMLTRMEELATQAANSVLATEDRVTIQDEIDELLAEINRVSEDMDFNGRKLLNGDLARRTYSSNENVKIYNMSNAVEADDYGITVTADATQAELSSVGMAGESYVVSEEQAGVIVINGIDITVSAGQTMGEVYADVIYYADLVGIDAFADDGTGAEVPYDQATGFTFKTQGYGEDEYIEINCENTELAALFGIEGALDQRVTGTDAKADFATGADGDRIGFSNAAAMKIDGNKITVVDRDNFEMEIMLTPGAVEAAGNSIDTTLTVLDAGPLNLQIGAYEGESIQVNIPKINTTTLDLDDIRMFTHELASEAMYKVQEAIKGISELRSYLGACQNRLEYTITNLGETEENMEKALSGIMDTNMAEEMTEYTQHSVLSQSATQMLSKANALPESLLQLIQTR